MSHRIIVDVSSTMDSPLTGVGWRTVYLIKAFLQLNTQFRICLFAARARKTPTSSFPFESGFEQKVVVPFFRRLKALLWPSVEWPPIEWFCGRADLVHGTFHDLPATHRAIRMVTVHDLSFLLHPETHTEETIHVQTRLIKHAVSRADVLEAVSESCKKDLIDVFNIEPGKIHVVPGGIDIAEWTAPLDLAALSRLKHSFGIKRTYFVHLGTIEPRKNLPRLLEAYDRIRKRFREYPQLVLVGTRGWKADMTLDTISRLDLNDDVVVTGWVPREAAVTLLRGAVACVYPSLYEGFGLPVLEAMAARIPVITSTASALREVSGGHCIYVDPLSVESIEAGLDLFLTKPDLAQLRAQNAFQKACQMTWDASARALLSLYQQILKDGNSA